MWFIMPQFFGEGCADCSDLIVEVGSFRFELIQTAASERSGAAVLGYCFFAGVFDGASFFGASLDSISVAVIRY